MYYGQTMRRSRKRAWSTLGRENMLQNNPIIEEKVEKPIEKMETNEPWMIKSMRKNEDNALELTTNVENIHQKLEDHQRQKTPKLEEQPLQFTPQHDNSSNLVLPPPPPIWYPPIYPTPPYGIDPLHFFIDLRVSGQIYDKHSNNQVKEGSSSISSVGNSTTISSPPKEPPGKTEIEQKNIKIEGNIGDIFSQKRHCSAFSVPNSSSTSKNRQTDKSQTRFDVKSMGFDRSSNKTGTNYIMHNITNIYKGLLDKKVEVALYNPYITSKRTDDEDSRTIEVDSDETRNKPENFNDISREGSGESDAEKSRKAKDLRALIGLELVVDYMSHKKGEVGRPNNSFVVSDGDEGEMSSDVESVGSPQLEVVAVQEEA